jgi:hypothetical protein
MTYAHIQDVPANEEIHSKIRAELGAEPPAGMILHVAIRQRRGLRYIDVWQDEESWVRFRDDRLEPVVARVLAGYGIVADHSMVRTQTLDVVDTWLGAA